MTWIVRVFELVKRDCARKLLFTPLGSYRWFECVIITIRTSSISRVLFLRGETMDGIAVVSMLTTVTHFYIVI